MLRFGDVRVKILNNVWCVGCAETTGIGNISGKKEKGIRGKQQLDIV
jgi:hypothetical protein